MKYTKTLSFAFAALLLMPSCSDDQLSTSPLEKIVKKTWMIMELDGTVEPLGELCSLDDEFKFYADNKISWNLGFDRCNNSEEMLQHGIWRFSSDGKSFSWNLGSDNYRQEFDVIELSHNRFSIKPKDDNQIITFQGFDYIVLE